jgi:hypothetical protein
MRGLWAFLAVMVPVLVSIPAPMTTVDLTYHLRAGREILATGAIPSVDTWTFTATGTPWFDQQWGAQVGLRLAEALGSWTGLVILRASLTAIIVGALFGIARRLRLDVRLATLMTLAAFIVALPAMGLRPQLFGMACFAVVLLAVAERRRTPRVIWAIPIIVAIWANLHGSFFLAPLVLGLAWIEDIHDRSPRARTTLAVAIVSVITACVTPFGPTVWLYVTSLSSNPEVTSQVTEWQPTSLRNGPGILFFSSALAIAVVLMRRDRPTPWPSLLWLGAFFAIGLYAVRGVAWWPLAAVATLFPLMPSRSEATQTRVDSPGVRRINGVIVAVAAGVGVALLPLWRPMDPGTRTPVGTLAHAPSGLTAALRGVVRPGDRIFNAQIWGSWFEYAFPEATVAVDSRVEMIPAEVWRSYKRVLSVDGDLPSELRDWDVRFVALQPQDRALADRLADAGWSVVRSDVDGSVLARP